MQKFRRFACHGSLALAFLAGSLGLHAQEAAPAEAMPAPDAAPATPQPGSQPVLTDRKHKVAVILPQGWTIEPAATLPMNMGVSPAEPDAIPATVNILSQPYKDGGLDAYVKANLEAMAATLPNLKLQDKQPMKSAYGVEMVKINSTNNMEGQALVQIFYLGAAGEGQFFIMTCTATPDTADQYKPQFDTIANSVKIFN